MCVACLTIFSLRYSSNSLSTCIPAVAISRQEHSSVWSMPPITSALTNWNRYAMQATLSCFPFSSYLIKSGCGAAGVMDAKVGFLLPSWNCPSSFSVLCRTRCCCCYLRYLLANLVLGTLTPFFAFFSNNFLHSSRLAWTLHQDVSTQILCAHC